MLNPLLLVSAAFFAPPPPSRAFIYVDPTDSDTFDARFETTVATCEEQGILCISVWSKGYATMLLNREDVRAEEAAEIRSMVAPESGDELAWAAACMPPECTVLGSVSGSDAGTGTSERLLDALAPASRSNGLLAARRDKYEMHEALRNAELAAAAQCVACTWEEAAAFVAGQQTPSRRVVLKPRRGAASLRVGLATSAPEARALFTAILAEPSSLDDDGGATAYSVLLQEYLHDTTAGSAEWVVDTVSRGGEHKVVALWRYDKGAANGAPFVYFAIEPSGCGDSDSVSGRVASYATRVLDALAWRWGPAHLEVMWMGDARGPVLVEANMGRWNGEEFRLLADVCFGVNAYDACYAALLADDSDAAAWAEIPHTPPPALRAAAKLVKLVSYARGPLVEVRHAEAIEELPSVLRVHYAYEDEGDLVRPTVDLNSAAGDVLLVHEDAEVVEADYVALRAMQPTLFAVEGGVDAKGEEEEEDGKEAREDVEEVLVDSVDVDKAVEEAERRARLEATEALRLAAAALAEPPSCEWATLAVRFPLVDGEFELRAAPASAAASSAVDEPRRLGAMLLRAVRTARDEATAIAHCEDLLK